MRLPSRRKWQARTQLTGAFNRRLFYFMSDREIERARRTGSSLTVVYFDLDGFKEVNDKLGHVHGDKLLNLVVDTVAKNIRGTDLFARLGGDEFAILQPDTDFANARDGLSKLRDVLCSETIANGFPVTFSMGVVTFNKPPESIEDMIHRADELMYKVKTTGKNSVQYEVVNSIDLAAHRYDPVESGKNPSVGVYRCENPHRSAWANDKEDAKS